MSFRALERVDHVVDDRRSREDVPLRRGKPAALVPGPLRRLRTGEGRVLALQVHHGELPSLLGPVVRQRIRILVPDLFDDRGRRRAAAQQLESPRPIADVHNRLRRRDASGRVGPQDAVADREHA